MYNLTFKVTQKLTQAQLDYLSDKIWTAAALMSQQCSPDPTPDYVFTSLTQRKVK